MSGTPHIGLINFLTVILVTSETMLDKVSDFTDWKLQISNLVIKLRLELSVFGLAEFTKKDDIWFNHRKWAVL